VQGDTVEGLRVLQRVALPEQGAGIAVDARTKAAVVIAALRFGVLGPPPYLPAEEVKLGGRAPPPHRHAAAMGHHYDVSNDFYRIVLGESMAYSCAYWPQQPARTPDGSAQAQYAKCDLVATKLSLGEGMRVLDVAAAGAPSRCTRPGPTAPTWSG